jgi:alkylhydroperoxidase/carboxymuconolactone decarboxylase family protein YurZ
MQTACYAGVPAAVQALNAAADVLQPKTQETTR